eukprot:COSAG01_NODE_1491_length_10131_cov_5.872508_3_plen_59_part_00
MVLCLSSDGPWAAQSFPRLWFRSLLIDSSWMNRVHIMKLRGVKRKSNFVYLIPQPAAS